MYFWWIFLKEPAPFVICLLLCLFYYYFSFPYLCMGRLIILFVHLLQNSVLFSHHIQVSLLSVHALFSRKEMINFCSKYAKICLI